MHLVLDAGALIAVARGGRDTAAVIEVARLDHRGVVVPAGVVGQVWRGGAGRQANLALLLRGVEVVGLGDDLGRQAGVLLATSRMSDVVDAAVVLLAADGDEIFTSDAADLSRLARAAGLHVDVVPV